MSKQAGLLLLTFISSGCFILLKYGILHIQKKPRKKKYLLRGIPALIIGILLAILGFCYSPEIRKSTGDSFWIFLPFSAFLILFISRWIFHEPYTHTKLSAYILILTGAAFILFSGSFSL